MIGGCCWSVASVGGVVIIVTNKVRHTSRKVDASLTSSRCMARVVAQVKRHMYALLFSPVY